jgi:tetratricopeptide (TPR) repeat protein
MSLDLQSRLLSEEVRSLHALGKTGILEVYSRQTGKGIYFRAGQVVFASSSLQEDRLGESLIRLGRISRADFAAAYDLEMGRRRRRIGQALVGAGLISEDELGKLVAHQVESIILSLFEWTTGEMRFHESNDPIPNDLALDLSTHRLLLEGIRVFPDEPRLVEALGDRRRKLRAARQAPFDYSRVPLSMTERTVFDEASRGARVADILAGPTPRPRLGRALYALVASGLLEDAESEALPPPFVPEVDARTFRVAMPEPPAVPPAGAAGLVAGPTPVAGTLAAATAAAQPAVPAAPGAPAVSPASEAEARADLLRLYEALPRATHYAVLGLRPDVTQADVTAAYARLSEDQDRRWKDLERDPRLASAIFTLKLRRREAHEALSDPARRADYDRALGALRPPSAVAAAPIAPPGRAAEPSATDLVKEARRLKDSGQPDRALPLLLKAVEKDPASHEARRELAIALAADPALAPKAERHFIAALEQDPLDTDLRYRLAVFYKKAGLKARALLHLRVVVGRDPNHPAAWRDLQELQSSLE